MAHATPISYIPGTAFAEPGPLARYLPPLESGTAADWLSDQAQPGAWVLDPFGSSPRLAVEAARAGYRVLVAANNPVSRFLLEMTANPPDESELKAALAELATAHKGDERLETHLQSLYLTPCATCQREISAQAFLWRKGEQTPYGRIYECRECGEEGERPTSPIDAERAEKIAQTAELHRARVLERVAALHDPDREYVEEAINHYLPRAIYALATLINRLDGLSLAPQQRSYLVALLLSACDQANTLWPYPTERPRPRQLTVPTQFRENNVWLALEGAIDVWAGGGAAVPLVLWPQKLTDSGGICLFEGSLRDLVAHIKEAPIQAVVSAIPRPNQAFWTLSALWAGWLWGRSAVTPFKSALRRRRYDWDWHAAALHAALVHLYQVLTPDTPFFGLLGEPEPSYLSAALVAAEAAGFELKGMSMRTGHDPMQLTWQRGKLPSEETISSCVEVIRKEVGSYLCSRGEPATYLHLHAVALGALAEGRALIGRKQSLDEALSVVHGTIQQALREDKRLERYDGSETNLEVGWWWLCKGKRQAPVADRLEVRAVSFLQNNPGCTLLELERDLYPQFPGLLTPSRDMLKAVLESYGEEQNGGWRLRKKDYPAARCAELEGIAALIGALGERIDYHTHRDEVHLLIWKEKDSPAYVFHLQASALVGPLLEKKAYPAGRYLLVLPGGRAGLLAYKQQYDPRLKQKVQDWQFVKFRLLRALADIPILTRQTFEEQIASDPVEQAKGQMMMF